MIIIRFFIMIAMLCLLASCQEEATPKPRAYARIDLPAHSYHYAGGEQWDCPYSFDFSTLSAITVDPRYSNKTCWYNIYYPKYKATIHLTYTALEGDLATHIEDSRKLAMKHISKAAQIEEMLVSKPEERVYGIVYDFAGETASDMQFFLTDSTDHFLRGALYFRVHPNKDSLGPVIRFVKEDIDQMISSFTWNDDGK